MGHNPHPLPVASLLQEFLDALRVEMEQRAANLAWSLGHRLNIEQAPSWSAYRQASAKRLNLMIRLGEQLLQPKKVA